MDDTLATLVSRALPGVQLRAAEPLGTATHLLRLSDGRRAVLRLGDVAAEAAALGLLASEIDLPLPELLAAEPDATGAPGPWLLRSYLEGVPLPEALDALAPQERYSLGRQLGTALQRVHRLACGRYGALVGDDPLASRDDMGYMVRRAEAALARAQAAGALPEQGLADTLRACFAQQYSTSAGQPALVHGGLRPAHILLRAREGRRLGLAGIVGWQHALAWAPGWDHALLLEACAEQAYFDLRVGYGQGYDEAVERPVEQVREYALLPFRLVLHLEALAVEQAPEARALRLRILAALAAQSGRGGAAAITPSA